jgi:SNF2 family DNA or RNA helicase
LTTVLHALWSDAALHLWAESAEAWSNRASPTHPSQPPRGAESHEAHPFAADPASLIATLASAGLSPSNRVVRIPAVDDVPLPSLRLALAVGQTLDLHAGAAKAVAFTVPTRMVPIDRVVEVLSALADDDALQASDVVLTDSVEFFAEAARLVRYLLVQQRFVPALRQRATGDMDGAWMPWVSDESNAQRVSKLVAAMPPSARCAVDRFNHEAWPIVEDFLDTLTDCVCRQALHAENFFESVEDRDPSADPHVAWLRGLLGHSTEIKTAPSSRQEIPRRVRGWIGLLEDRGTGSSWRLLLRLNEPAEAMLPTGAKPDESELEWNVTFHLQSVDRPSLVLEASDLWLLAGDALTVQGKRVEGPQEIILKELGRASRLYRRLEEALEDSQPSQLSLSTKQAYEFLREVRPILMEQGFAVQVPDWWDSPMARLGARLRVDSGEPDAADAQGRTATSSAAGTQLGLGALVKYRWEIAVGDTSLSLHEFEALAAKRTPLVRVNGRWVEIRPEDVQNAIKFIRENPGGEMSVGDALRMAYASDLKDTGIPVIGLEASGWLQAFLASEANAQSLAAIEPPKSFLGTLRPYQTRGVSWMAFMERLGFGLCLADDMGLGKTIQLLALMAHEREHAGQPLPSPGPTLLLVPMSVVGNWIHETKRFCPHLRVVVHHGTDRLLGQTLIDAASNADLVITTYALAHRDRETLSQINWWRIVLDEAQYIKNPAAKQTQAVRSFKGARRVALTGTPVENRLAELWSIMDFLNPTYLGTAGGFRQRFGVAIERYHDKARSEQLRGLIRPFVLRRLKTDPTVVADLPEKVESREYCHLTSEQASLYESCVRRMLAEVEEAEGIQRRGLVLSALIKLKQICNHPAQLLKDHDKDVEDASDENTPKGAVVVQPSRSGKCIRLVEMLDEVLAEGDKALVFTQFRQMGHMLQGMLRHQLGRDVLFLHGGTTQAQRQSIIETFQKEGTAPILILSLKAGGVGLNLTAATHVFHFDRWWNPAVENQATDRAYRIGQTRTVQVHKFVVRGTLEERIDQMIESKTALAENIIGSGEQWLTELDTSQLREILTLRNDAVSDEA